MLNYIKHPYKKLTYLQSTIFNEIKDEYFCPLNKLYWHKNNSGHSYAILLKIIEFLEKTEGKNIFIYCKLTEQATYLYHYICNSKLLKKHIAIYLADRNIKNLRFKSNIKKSIFVGKIGSMKGGKIIPDLIICDQFENIISDRDNLTYLSKIYGENENIQIYFFTSNLSAKFFSKLSFINNLKKIFFEGKNYKTEKILCTYKSSEKNFFTQFDENILKRENKKEEKEEQIREIKESNYHLTEYIFPVQTNSIPIFICEILRSVFSINKKVVIFCPNFTIDFINELLISNQYFFTEDNLEENNIFEKGEIDFSKVRGEKKEKLKIYVIDKKRVYEEKKYILEQFNSNMIDHVVLLCGSQDGMPFNCTFFSALNLFRGEFNQNFLKKELNKYKQLNLNKYEGRITSEFKLEKEEIYLRKDKTLIQEKRGKYLFDLKYPSIINIPYRYKLDEQISLINNNIKIDSEAYMKIIKQLEKNKIKF